MTMKKHQRGLSFVSLFFVLTLFGFLAIFAIKLIPSYLEYFNVRSIMESFKTEATQYNSMASLRDSLEKRFEINDVKSITAADVLIEPVSGGYSLHVDYEVRVPFVSNISLVTSFSEDGQARGGSELAQ